jgi:hypothetical protein
MAFDLAKEIGKEIVYTTAGVGSLLPLIGLTRANSQAFNPASLTIKMERLIFPADLANYPLSMCFDIHKYERRSMFKQPKLPIKGQIRLPVAKNIQDSFSADWNAENQSPIVGAAVENLLKGGPITDPQSILDQSMNIAGTVVGGLVGAGGGALVEASKRALQQAPTIGANPQDILQPFGYAVNPFLTVMFKQPTFKEYNFTWKLIPRDPKEARTINSIIRALKYAMLPDINVDNGGTLLEYPYIIQTNFYGNDNYLYKFKPAAIKNVTVNYAPATTPSFFKGSQNVPTEVELKIHMIEIEYWTKQDIYENDPNLSVELTEAEKVAMLGAVT